jgi:hypothetical protein
VFKSLWNSSCNGLLICMIFWSIFSFVLFGRNPYFVSEQVDHLARVESSDRKQGYDANVTITLMVLLF